MKDFYNNKQKNTSFSILIKSLNIEKNQQNGIYQEFFPNMYVFISTSGLQTTDKK